MQLAGVVGEDSRHDVVGEDVVGEDVVGEGSNSSSTTSLAVRHGHGERGAAMVRGAWSGDGDDDGECGAARLGAGGRRAGLGRSGGGARLGHEGLQWMAVMATASGDGERGAATATASVERWIELGNWGRKLGRRARVY